LIVFTGVLVLALSYVTFRLVEHGFQWWALFPGAFAVLLLISFLGMLFPSEPDGEERRDEQASTEEGRPSVCRER